MTLRVIEITAGAGHLDTIQAIADTYGALEHWSGVVDEEGRSICRLLVRREEQQAVLDVLQSTFSGESKWRILLLPVEAAIPDPEKSAGDSKPRSSAKAASREELYNDVSQGTLPDRNFILLVVLSTLVAAIGLLKDNVAVVIGAMVIAPLLGPNLAFAFGSALGDRALMAKALRANFLGLAIALAISVVLGLLLPIDPDGASAELLARTGIAFDGVALALASGAAAALCLTSGLSSTLVGVMVAVALLPPTATLGIMLGSGAYGPAFGAGMLLAANVVCVNLSAQVFFLTQGIKPRTWLEKRQAGQSVAANIFVWALLLCVLGAVIYLRNLGLTL